MAKRSVRVLKNQAARGPMPVNPGAPPSSAIPSESAPAPLVPPMGPLATLKAVLAPSKPQVVAALVLFALGWWLGSLWTGLLLAAIGYVGVGYLPVLQ